MNPQVAKLPSTFGPFGGSYLPEVLIPSVERLEVAAAEAMADPAFLDAVRQESADWSGRPTPLTFAPRLSEAWGAEVWLKREDLAHTGAHKINNAIGQALLAKRMGVERVVAETGAGQHGVASAAACARVGLPCRVYMGAIDVERQAPNVQRMRLFGAEVVAVEEGDATLRAAIDEALRAWASDPEGTYYLIGSVVGPHPYPALVAEFQRVIGDEAREQLGDRTPDAVVACVGGGSNAIGLFKGFLGLDGVQCLGIEAGGRGAADGEHGATIASGTVGVLHGAKSLLLQDAHGQVSETHSVSAGLDYPGVGPEHADLATSGRARYASVTDREALDALSECCRLEGILPALETAHAFAGARQFAERHPGSRILIGCSGRGDKDLALILAEQESS